MLKFLQHILQLVISPARGWEDVSSAGAQPDELTRRGLYPMLAIASLSCIIMLLYHEPGYTLIEALQNAVITFTVYFVTLFIAGHAFTSFMPTISGNANSPLKNSTFIIFNLAILVTINIIDNLIPVDLVIVKILPAYVFYVMFRGIRYLDVAPDKTGQFMFLSVFSIGVPPFLLYFLFKLVMPEV